MITEIAQIDVKPGTEKDFEAAVAKARPLFLRAKGGKGFELHKSIEKPSRYRLMAKWETLENHTVDFRGSEDFTAWRALVGQYFAAPPEVEHTETVLSSCSGSRRLQSGSRPRAAFLWSIDALPDRRRRPRLPRAIALWYNLIERSKYPWNSCDGPSAGRRSHGRRAATRE
jgi:heme-degrading monooxygenase HmoA